MRWKVGIIRDSFVIFKNWAEAIETMPEEYQLETYKALVRYGVNGVIPEDISPFAKAMLVSFSRDMENNIAKYKASVENGKKGGNPNFKKGQSNPYYAQKTDNQSITEDNPKITEDNLDEPSDNLYVNVYVNDNDILKKEINKEKNTILTDSELYSLIEGSFSDSEVCNKFKDYAEMRKAMGKNKAIRTKSTLDSCIQKLRKYARTKEEALDILDYSIANCYQGLFDRFNHGKKSANKEAIPYAN